MSTKAQRRAWARHAANARWRRARIRRQLATTAFLAWVSTPGNVCMQVIERAELDRLRKASL